MEHQKQKKVNKRGGEKSKKRKEIKLTLGHFWLLGKACPGLRRLHLDAAMAEAERMARFVTKARGVLGIQGQYPKIHLLAQKIAEHHEHLMTSRTTRKWLRRWVTNTPPTRDRSKSTQGNLISGLWTFFDAILESAPNIAFPSHIPNITIETALTLTSIAPELKSTPIDSPKLALMIKRWDVLNNILSEYSTDKKEGENTPKILASILDLSPQKTRRLIKYWITGNARRI